MAPFTPHPEDIIQLEKNFDQQTQNLSRLFADFIRQAGADQSKVRAVKDFTTNSTVKNQEKFLQAGFTEKQVEEFRAVNHLYEKAFKLRWQTQSAIWKELDEQTDKTLELARILSKDLDVFSKLSAGTEFEREITKTSSLVKDVIIDTSSISEEIKKTPLSQHDLMLLQQMAERMQKMQTSLSATFSARVPEFERIVQTLEKETRDLLSEGKTAKAENVEDLKLRKEKLGKYKEKYALLTSLDNEQFAFQENAQRNLNLLDKEILRTDKQILDLEKQKSSIDPKKKAMAYPSSDKTSETLSPVTSEIATAYAQNFDTSISPAERRAKRAALITQAAKLDENQIISIMDELKSQTTVRNGELYRKDMIFAAEIAPHLGEPLQKKMLDFAENKQVRSRDSIPSKVGNDKVKQNKTSDRVTIPEQIVQQMVDGGKATTREIMSLAQNIGVKISSYTAGKMSDDIQGNSRKRTVVDKAKDLFHTVTASPKTKVFKKYIKSAIADSKVR